MVSALAAWRARHPESGEALDPLIRRGLVFLMRKRSPAGTWASTQSNLVAMRALTDAVPVLGGSGGGAGPEEVTVRVNGRIQGKVTVARGVSAPVRMRLDLPAGSHEIALEPEGAGRGLTAALVYEYWTPWAETAPARSAELRFTAAFDKAEARVGERIRCEVDAERVGFRGYGMMIAEVGLPAGAEVDRGSLERVIEEGGADQYEVRPDGVLFYLWPKAGRARFAFDFRPRFPMTAKSAVRSPSSVTGAGCPGRMADQAAGPRCTGVRRAA